MGPRFLRAAGRGGILAKLLLFLLAIGAMLALAWMLFLPGLLAGSLQRRMGFSATVNRFYANPFTASIDVNGLTVANPPHFPSAGFLEIREFKAQAETGSLLGDRPVLDLVIIDVDRLTVVVNHERLSNVELLQKRLKNPAGGLSGSSNPGEKPLASGLAGSSKARFLIRRLEVRFGELRLNDHSGVRPVERTVRIAYQHTFENVTETTVLPAEIAPALAAIGPVLAALLPGELGRTLARATREQAGRMKEAGQRAADSLRGRVDALEETPKP